MSLFAFEFNCRSTNGFMKAADPLGFSNCAIQISSFIFKSWIKVMNDFFPIGLVGNVFFRVLKFGLSFLGTERPVEFLMHWDEMSYNFLVVKKKL